MNPQRRLALAAALVAACAAPGLPALGQAKPQVHETTVEGVTAEIVEAVRKEGVLTMKVRYRNESASPAAFKVYRNWDDTDYYVTAGSTKLMVLKDSKGTPVAVPHSVHGTTDISIKPKGSFLFWAKFPAPPADAKKIAFYHPHSPPIEDIPVTDAK
jgi:hypothetical protein